MATILVVDDEPKITRLVRDYLESAGFTVVTAADGREALMRARTDHPDLVVLDLGLPQLDGLDVTRRLRRDGDLPIIMLTARDDEADKLVGLELGADDYVTKPFGLLELMARVAALLRRSRPTPEERTRERFGDVEIDLRTRAVTRRGESLPLTPMEFDLLVALVRRDGAVAGRLELLREVWGHSAAVLTRTVDTHIAELRRKLEDDPAAPRHILTVRKAGYRLNR